MRAWITKGAVRIIAEEYPKQGDLPVEILTEMEKDMLMGLRGRTFKARDYCNAPSAKKGTKKGTLEIYLVEIDIKKLLPENGELPPMSYPTFVNKIREIVFVTKPRGNRDE